MIVEKYMRRLRGVKREERPQDVAKSLDSPKGTKVGPQSPVQKILRRGLPVADPEAAKEGLRKAREAGAHYKRDFQDILHWEDLARKYKVRLPQWHMSPTMGQQKKWLKKLGIDSQDYLREAGLKKLEDFRGRNPGWCLRAFVGVLLEWKDEGRFDKDV